MPTIAESATVRVRGGNVPVPGSRDEEIVLAAWQMYRYVNARAMRTGGKMVHLAADGHTWDGDLEEVAHVLWPAGTMPVSDGDGRWDHAYQTVKNWLLINKNIAAVSIGRPETRTKREGVISSRLPHWWVREHFAGAPAGMKLPELDENGRPEPVIELPAAPTPAPPRPAPVPAADERDWWCPFSVTGNCMESGPYTRQDFRLHVIKSHKFQPGGGMYDRVMEQAEELREDRLGSMPLPLSPSPFVLTPAAPPTPTEARSIMDMIGHEKLTPLAPLPPRPPAHDPLDVAAPRTRVRQRPSAPAPGTPPPPIGAVSAQARVFAGQIADLEAEVARLRRDVEVWRERAMRAEAADVQLSQRDMDAIARRTVDLLQSRNGH